MKTLHPPIEAEIIVTSLVEATDTPEPRGRCGADPHSQAASPTSRPSSSMIEAAVANGQLWLNWLGVTRSG
ncbi:MAG: hypothetical protein AAF913_10245 [Pseudomonadota bacterium]